MKIVWTILLMMIGNALMAFAWYWHLKAGNAESKPFVAILLVSWGIAFFEYCVMIPANRLGFSAGLTVGQLKIIQEIVTLCVFLPFALFYIGEKWKLDYLWAFFCLIGAVYFVNRSKF